MQRLACNEVLGDLPFELDAVGAVLGHGFHPLKARQPRSIPNLQSVHRQGRTPIRVKFGSRLTSKFDCLGDPAVLITVSNGASLVAHLRNARVTDLADRFQEQTEHARRFAGSAV